MQQNLISFWQLHPALLYGIAALLGVYLLDGWMHLTVLLPAVLLLLTAGDWRRRLLCVGVGFIFYGYVTLYYDFPDTPLSGKGIFTVQNISLTSTQFGKKWLYTGVLDSFEHLKNVPVRVSLPIHVPRPLGDQKYVVKGHLKPSLGKQYVLHTRGFWVPHEPMLPVAEYRFHAKKRLQEYIRTNISSSKATTFLAGIATGEFDDKNLSREFSRFGLQHIMAISGFHFAIVASCLYFLLQCCFSRRSLSLALMFCLTLYFTFLGASASVLRAWISLLVVLGGLCIGRASSGLNTLGVALLVVLIFDPLAAFKIGFQFSFAITASILLLYSPCDRLMREVFPTRYLSELLEMSLTAQHGYCLLALFRQAFALVLAVNLSALPMTLYFFHKFPLLSLGYNLFFPFLVGGSIFLLMISLFCFWLPPLAYCIHAINGLYTEWLLDFTHYLPMSVDITLRVSELSALMLVTLLCVLFVSGVYYKTSENWHHQ